MREVIIGVFVINYFWIEIYFVEIESGVVIGVRYFSCYGILTANILILDTNVIISAWTDIQANDKHGTTT